VVIAGSIAPDGTIVSGKGFTVEYDAGSPGVYIVRTQPRYPRTLSAVANTDGDGNSAVIVRSQIASDVNGPYVQFRALDDTGTPVDDNVHFIIVAQNTSLRG